MMTNFRNATQSLYPIELPVRYEVVARDRIRLQQGEGTTVGIGSRVVRFRTDQDVEVSRKVRLEMAWPASLPDGTSLNLWIHGRVSRSESSYVDVEVAKYEFRTRRSMQLAKALLAHNPIPKLVRFAAAGR
jgi:hypothetical protein